MIFYWVRRIYEKCLQISQRGSSANLSRKLFLQGFAPPPPKKKSPPNCPHSFFRVLNPTLFTLETCLRGIPAFNVLICTNLVSNLRQFTLVCISLGHKSSQNFAPNLVLQTKGEKHSPKISSWGLQSWCIVITPSLVICDCDVRYRDGDC